MLISAIYLDTFYNGGWFVRHFYFKDLWPLEKFNLLKKSLVSASMGTILTRFFIKLIPWYLWLKPQFSISAESLWKIQYLLLFINFSPKFVFLTDGWISKMGQENKQVNHNKILLNCMNSKHISVVSCNNV